MKRKRRWVQEYRCKLFSVNILERLVYCKESVKDKKCRECKYRGNEDGLNVEVSLKEEEKLEMYVSHLADQQEESE